MGTLQRGSAEAILFRFFSPLGFASMTETKTKVIPMGLQEVLKLCREHLIMDADFSCSISWAEGSSTTLWKLVDVVEVIHDMIRGQSAISILFPHFKSTDVKAASLYQFVYPNRDPSFTLVLGSSFK